MDSAIATNLSAGVVFVFLAGFALITLGVDKTARMLPFSPAWAGVGFIIVAVVVASLLAAFR